MAIRESIHSQKKLHRTITELIRVLRKIQKTMMLCIAIFTQYRIEINTHDLQACLSKIYASLDEFLTDDARKLVKTYAQNYETESANVNAQVDIVVDSGNQIQQPKVRMFFSNIGQSISRSYRKWFKSDAKEQELRELMNELTPFLVLLLSQSVLQFMVCQTSMITEDGKMIELKDGNDAVKQSCQYKDFQLSALLDSIMRIRDDLDRDLANRDSHINALTKEVTRVTKIVAENSNYSSFVGLTAKLETLSGLIAAGNYDNIRANLDDLNTYDEQVFFKECNGQTQTQPAAIKSTAPGPGTDGIETPDRSSPSPRFPGLSSEPLLLDHGNIDVEIDDSVSSIGSSNPLSRTSSTSSITSNHPIRSLSNSSVGSAHSVVNSDR